MPQTTDNPEVRAPRLGIGHLMLWVACCAVYFAFLREMARGESTDFEPGLIGLAIASLIAVGHGAATAGLLIFLSRRLRRVRWPIEPGEWLLAALGARLAAELVAHRWLVPDYLRSPEGAAAALTCCMLVLPTLSRHVSIAWKVFFSATCLLFAKPLAELCLKALEMPLEMPATIGLVVDWLTAIRWLLLGLPAVVLSIYDQRRDRPRGWLHWIGVATLVWYLALLAWL